MKETIIHFFEMSGYGCYVFSAYGCVITFLLLQWFIPWIRFRRYLTYSTNNKKE